MGKVRRGITEITNIRRGNTSLSKVYRGQSLIWQPSAGAAYVTQDLYVYVDPFAGFDGTTITDLSPTPKAVTRGNSITTTGAIGGTGGWDLNATSPNSKYFYFNNAITSATSYSYEIFFKVNSGVTFNNEPNMLAVLGNANFDTRFGMKGNSSSNICFAQAQDQVGNSCDSHSSTTMIDSTWHQWVYTYNTSTRLVSLYKDATLIDSDTLPGSGNNFASNTVDTYCMGPINASYIWGFNGALGGLVRVYTSELSSAQVTQNYNANKADYGL